MEAIVKNAADRKQIRHSNRKETDLRNRELGDLIEVLSSAAGRRLLWRVMNECGIWQDPTDPRGDKTHQAIGRANVGRFILAEICQADHDAWITMQLEHREELRRLEEEARAVRTPRAAAVEGDDDDV